MKLYPLATLAAAVTGALGVPSQTATPVLISDHTRADSAVERCLAGSPGQPAAWADNEPSAVAHPSNGRHLLAAWQTNGGGRSVIQSAVSEDGGATWSAPRAMPVNRCAGGPVEQAARASDPWVTIAPDGRAYVAGIAWQPNPGGGPDLESVIVVSGSSDGGRTWGAPTVAARGSGGLVWHDNVAITADPVRPGTVHLVTTRYERVDSVTRYGPVGYTVSKDGGVTWAPIRTITPNVNRGRMSAPVIAADSRRGVLYLAYYRAERPDRVIGVRRSEDGGETWGPEVTVTPHTPGTQPQLEPLEGKDRPLADDIIRPAIDPRTGTLVLAYADARQDPRGRLGVSLVWTHDGRTWSEPVSVSDDGPETAWLPAVAVADGTVGVLFLSALMARTDSGLAPVTVHLRRFRVVGSSLTPLGSDTLDRANYAWPGDYQALVAVGRGFRAIYARSTLGPGERFPPSEGDPRRANPSDIYSR